MNTLTADVRPANPWHRIVRAIEPWYDWGTIYIERMQGTTLDRSGGEGGVRYFQLQWFGLHLGFQIGTTPKRGC